LASRTVTYSNYRIPPPVTPSMDTAFFVALAIAPHAAANPNVPNIGFIIGNN
ncbi:hypothetical protein CHS0354_025141, partial [Potamilus streckersoni]